VPARIHIHQRIIHTVAIPVERLKVPRLGYQGVGGYEPPQLWIVEAGVVVVEACLVIVLLAGEGVVGIGEGGIEVLPYPVGAEGVVVDRLLRVPLIVGDDGGGAEVVRVVVEGRAVGAYGCDPLAVRIDVDDTG